MAPLINKLNPEIDPVMNDDGYTVGVKTSSKTLASVHLERQVEAFKRDEKPLAPGTYTAVWKTGMDACRVSIQRTCYYDKLDIESFY